MRIRGLDFLRGIAIIGVLCRHIEADFFLSGPGGYGVDLFFVLSGFLVSGLLFKEYLSNGNADVKRFLIRRGFKIYPAFYFFLLVTVWMYGFGSTNSTAILSEIFFLQSYLKPMWSHTWSLAVEEHFYFLLAFFVIAAIRFKWIQRERLMIGILAGMILLPLGMRLVYVYQVYRFAPEPFYYTHLRIDGLFTGALLGYLWHFKKNLLEKFYARKNFFLVLSILLIVPAFIFSPGSLWMVTIGFSMLHLAFSFILLLAVDKRRKTFFEGNAPARKIISLVKTTGVFSYSIYLWHLPVQNILLRNIGDLSIETPAYLVASVVTGILASIIIEKPMLKIRDRYFPKRA